jgi:transposase InsO family protein
VPIADGSNLYLATVIDCHSRRLVGWAVVDHMRTELVTNALQAAAATRGSLTGAIFHFRPRVGLHLEGIREAVRRARGDPVDGRRRHERGEQPGRGVNATVKREVLQDENCWPDEVTCRPQLFRWLTRYNTRRHSWCRYLSPIAYEALTAATLPSAA